MRAEVWVTAPSSAGTQLIVEAIMKVDMIIRNIYLGRTGKQCKGKRTEQGIRNESVPCALPHFTSIITLFTWVFTLHKSVRPQRWELDLTHFSASSQLTDDQGIAT